MTWHARLLVASALCVACKIHPPPLADLGDDSMLDFGDLDPDLEGDPPDLTCTTGPHKPTVFIALPDIRIYVLDYPGLLPGQSAWFSDHHPCVRHAFYLADPSARAEPPGQRGEATALREFHKVCGAAACRRGDMKEVRATWAAQLQQWQSADDDLFAAASFQPSPHRLP